MKSRVRVVIINKTLKTSPILDWFGLRLRFRLRKEYSTLLEYS